MCVRTPDIPLLLAMALLVPCRGPFASHAPIDPERNIFGNPVPARQTAVVVVSERVEVTLTPAKDSQTQPAAEIRVEYKLKNTAEERQSLTLAFPVPETSWPPPDRKPWRGKRDKDWFVARQDGRRLGVEERPVGYLYGYPEYKAMMLRRAKLYAEWVKRVPGLEEKFAPLRDVQNLIKGLAGARSAFLKAAEESLGDPKLARAAECVLRDPTDFRSVVRLIPAIEPSLRCGPGDGAQKYLSLLAEDRIEPYRPYEAEWREKIANWINASPELSKLAEARTRLYELRTRQRNLREDLCKYLHDECGVPADHAPSVSWGVDSAGNVALPPTRVLEALLPAVKGGVDAAREAISAWGLDRELVSPFTGRLYRPANRGARWDSGPPLDRDAPLAPGEPYFGWNALNGPLRNWGSGRRLMKYSVEVAPEAESMIIVEYRVGLDYDDQQFGLKPYYVVPQLTYVLKTAQYWKRLGPVSIRISIPPEHYAIGLPEDGRSKRENGATIHELVLNAPSDNVRLGLVSTRKEDYTSSHLLEFIRDKEEHLEEMRRTLRRATRKDVVPLLRAGIVNQLCRMQWRHRAWEEYCAYKKEYGDSPLVRLCCLRSEMLDWAKATHNWIEGKVKSPGTDLLKCEWIRRGGMSDGDKRVLAEKLAASQDRYTGAQDQLGAAARLCALGVDTKGNLARILSIAQTKPEMAFSVLKLLPGLPGDKTPALPFILRHVNPNPKSIKGDTFSREWNTHTRAVQNLRTLTGPAVVPRLLELYRKTEDGLIRQEVMRAFTESGPSLSFEQMVELGLPVELSEYAVQCYLGALKKMDPEKVIPFLRSLQPKPPRYAPRIDSVLARLGDRSVLDGAIKRHNTSSCEQWHNRDFISAAGVLYVLRDPSMFRRIKYRADAERHIPERLVRVIAEIGGDEHAFKFVEKYYLQHVRGGRPRDGGACVRAFVRLGDRRAVPHLRELATAPEKNAQAAHAIGLLTLDRCIPESDLKRDETLRSSVWEAEAGENTSEKRAKAISVLLADRAASLPHIARAGMLHHMLTSPSTPRWGTSQLERLRYLARFGDEGMQFLLTQSKGCRLEQRYNLARVMSMFPAETHPRLREAAARGDDADQRKTAILALSLVRDMGAVPVLVELLTDEELRRNAIEALGKIGDPAAIPALKRLRREIAEVQPSGYFEEVWLAAIDKACAALTRP